MALDVAYTACPNKNGVTHLFTLTFTVCTDLHGFWYATLQMDTHRTDNIT